MVIWDRGRIAWDKPRVAADILKYLYERMEMHLEELGERRVVIADVPGGGPADHTKWLASSFDLTIAVIAGFLQGLALIDILKPTRAPSPSPRRRNRSTD